MACVGGCLGPAEQHGEEQFRAGKRDQPEAHRKPRRAPSQTPHRMARRPGMEAMEPPRSKRAAGEDQASAVESGDSLLEGGTARTAEWLANPAAGMPWIHRGTRDRIAEGG